MTASNGPSGGDIAEPTSNATSRPRAAAFSRAFESMPSDRSRAVTSYRSSAASRLSDPVPAPMSSTEAGGSGSARRRAARQAAASSGSDAACDAEWS